MKKIVSIFMTLLATIGLTIGSTGCGEKAKETLGNIGGMISEVIEEHGISLKTRAVSADEAVATAESAIEVTATVSPASMSNYVKLDWSVEFSNPSSDWASGKTATDYVTVTPSSDGAKTATVSCLQEFGSLIMVKAAVRGQSDVYATVSCGYTIRPDKVTAQLGTISDFISFHFEKDKVNTIKLTSSQYSTAEFGLLYTSGGVGTTSTSYYGIGVEYNETFISKLEAAGWSNAGGSLDLGSVKNDNMGLEGDYFIDVFMLFICEPALESELFGEYQDDILDVWAAAKGGSGSVTEEQILLYNQYRTAFLETLDSGEAIARLTLTQYSADKSSVLQEYYVDVTYSSNYLPAFSATGLSLNNGGITF